MRTATPPPTSTASRGIPGLVSSQTDPDGTTTTFTYNGAGEVTSQVVSFGELLRHHPLRLRLLRAQVLRGRPLRVRQVGYLSRPRPPSSPPTPSSDPYLGATITTYDADGRVIQATNPLGGITYTAYDEAGEPFCTVAPYEAAKGVTCPSSAPSSPPTIGSDSYLGATITTYDAERSGRPGDESAGGHHPHHLRRRRQRHSRPRSSPTTRRAAPNIVTSNSYDADNRVISTTVGSGSSNPSTTLTTYDPNGNAFCTVSANAYAVGSSAYQCPTWQPAWITAPPSPATLYSSTPTSAQANNVTTTFFNADGEQLQSTNPDVADLCHRFRRRRTDLLHLRPTNVSAWLTAHPSGTYPYLCPSTPPTSSPPAQGRTRDTSPPSSTPLDGRFLRPTR